MNYKSFVKYISLTYTLQKKLLFSSLIEVKGIFREAVKCVDIEKNTKGEGTLLGQY